MNSIIANNSCCRAWVPPSILVDDLAFLSARQRRPRILLLSPLKLLVTKTGQEFPKPVVLFSCPSSISLLSEQQQQQKCDGDKCTTTTCVEWNILVWMLFVEFLWCSVYKWSNSSLMRCAQFSYRSIFAKHIALGLALFRVIAWPSIYLYGTIKVGIGLGVQCKGFFCNSTELYAISS